MLPANGVLQKQSEKGGKGRSLGALLERNSQPVPPRTMQSLRFLSSVASDLPPRGFHSRSPASFQLQNVLQKVATIWKHHLFWEKQEEIDSCLISPLPPCSPLPAPPHRSDIGKKKKSPTGSVVRGRGRPGAGRRRWLRAPQSRAAAARGPHEWLLQPRPREAEPRPDKEPHLHGRPGLAGSGQAGRTSSRGVSQALLCPKSGR